MRERERGGGGGAGVLKTCVGRERSVCVCDTHECKKMHCMHMICELWKEFVRFEL